MVVKPTRHARSLKDIIVQMCVIIVNYYPSPHVIFFFVGRFFIIIVKNGTAKKMVQTWAPRGSATGLYNV